jgi:hypothetical protein
VRPDRSAIIAVLITSFILSLPLGAAAQEDDSLAPAAVLGWALDETYYAEGESGEVDGMFVRDSVGYTYTFASTDPRLSGDALWIGSGHRFPTNPMFEVQSATWEITTADGAWSGTSTALVGNGLGDTDTIVLTGSGAYQGLMAYLVMNWTRAGGSFRGAIFPGGMPPVPGT